MKKLKRTGGETLVETIAAVLIIALAMSLLPGAIVSASRANRAAEKVPMITDVTASDYASLLNGVTVTMTYGAYTTAETCDLHWNGNGVGGLYYYD